MSDTSLDTTAVDELVRRNADFAKAHDVAGLTMLPTGRTIVVGCVDPRVDPTAVLGLRLGEAAVIRNIGGRITPAAQRTLALLGAIARSGGTQPGPGWDLVVIHHTDCGIGRLLDHPDGLAAELGTSPDALDRDSITDPRASLAVDLAILRANPLLPPGLIVSGLLYDTQSGRLETVVAPAALGTQ
ncbi:MAG TPA: carbonic anhydrase [Jatrophihabitantaceae bacterium]|jgi:carbonic anhydrase